MSTLGCGPRTEQNTVASRESLTALPPRDAAVPPFALSSASGGGVGPADWPATVREVLSSGASVGRRVRVTGRCLGPASARTLGPVPRGLDAWELEADGVRVYVIGLRPADCLTTGAGVPTTITAVVAEDTLPPLGDLPASPRRYLARVVPEPAAPARP